MKLLVLAVAALFVFATTASADDKKKPGPIQLKLVAKTDKYKFDAGGATPEEYKKALAELANFKNGGLQLKPTPKPPAVDLVLQIVNTSKEEVTVFVGGDTNVYTFELTGGDGVAALPSGLAFTADFRLPKAVTLAAGKSYDIPVKQLSDGSRGASRYVYWTGPGEYKLSATYVLTDKDGNKTDVLRSEPVKITVEK